MDREAIFAMIRECLEAVDRERHAREHITVSEATPLLDDDSPLDSLEFVAFSTDLEGRLLRRTGRDLGLMAAAITLEDQPFRTVGTLTAYISARLKA